MRHQQNGKHRYGGMAMAALLACILLLLTPPVTAAPWPPAGAGGHATTADAVAWPGPAVGHPGTTTFASLFAASVGPAVETAPAGTAAVLAPTRHDVPGLRAAPPNDDHADVRRRGDRGPRREENLGPAQVNKDVALVGQRVNVGDLCDRRGRPVDPWRVTAHGAANHRRVARARAPARGGERV